MKSIILIKLFLISAIISVAQVELPRTYSTNWLSKKYVEDLLIRKDLSKRKEYCKPFERLFTHNGSLYVQTYMGKYGQIKTELSNDTLKLKDYDYLFNLIHISRDDYKDVTFLVKSALDSIMIVQRKDNVDIDSVLYVFPLEEYKHEQPFKTEVRLLLSGKFRFKADIKDEEIIKLHTNGQIISKNWVQYRTLGHSVLIKNNPVKGRTNYKIELEDNKENYILFINDRYSFELYKTSSNKRNEHFLQLDSRVLLTPIFE